jgi:hypothetical protein
MAHLPAVMTSSANNIESQSGASGSASKDRRKPAVKRDQDRAIRVRKPDANLEPAPQNSQLMPKHRVLSLKPHLRLD